MSLEAQLLKIIEEQQLQLKQQQQEQQKALELIQAQSMTIEELKELHANFKRETQRSGQDSAEISANNAKIIRTNYLSRFSQAIQENLKTQLQTRLSDLVQNLQIENQAKAILANSLPRLAQSEIEQQLKPMTDQIIKRMTSVEQYQQKLAELIQQVSSALDQIDKRRELQRAQERKNDRGYDSPSPF